MAEREAIRIQTRNEPNGNKKTIVAEAIDAKLAEWQRRWTAKTSVAGWTRRLLPFVHRWLGQLPGLFVTYRLAQMLFGHGAYNEYLFRFGISTLPSCVHCDAPVDDAKHTLFVRQTWEDMRAELTTVLGRHAGPNDVEDLLYGGGSAGPVGPLPQKGVP